MTSQDRDTTGVEEEERRLVCVMGVHVVEEGTACRVESVEPPGAAKDLGWSGMLALEGVAEGRVTVSCETGKTVVLEVVAPVRLEIRPVEEHDPLKLQGTEPVQVRATVFDREGRELEIGKFTELDWSVSGPLEAVPDRSAGEFGYCDACYGMFRFRALRTGSGTVAARLGELRGTLQVAAEVAT